MSYPLGNDLERFSNRHGLGRQLAATKVVATANQLSGGRYTARSFQHGRLLLVVSSSAVRTRLEAVKEDIRTSVNTRLGKDVVLNVRIRVEPISL